MQLRRLLRSVLFAGVVCILRKPAIAEDRVHLQIDLIDWVRSKGGSFSDKLEIRRVDPSNEESYLGIFVKEAIEENESLFVIPRDCYIEIVPEDGVDEDLAYLQNVCSLSQKLGDEMNLGSESNFAPYIAYLKTQSPGQLPVHWSPEAKNLLRMVSASWTSVVDWIDQDFSACVQSDDPAFASHMLEMTKQRSFDTALIPIWDMVNHHNGRINTENNSMYDPQGLKVTASRFLEEGEEIFASYDLCVDCKGVDGYWGTPEILRDFGFLENYPHRWVFETEEIWFEIYQVNNTQLVAWFGEEEDATEWVYLEENQMEFLHHELERLQNLSLPDPEGIPPHQWETVLLFYNAYMTDLEVAIEYQEILQAYPSSDEL